MQSRSHIYYIYPVWDVKYPVHCIPSYVLFLCRAWNPQFWLSNLIQSRPWWPLHRKFLIATCSVLHCIPHYCIGAIELSVFSKYYKTELDVVDVQTQRVDRFGKDCMHGVSGFLVYVNLFQAIDAIFFVNTTTIIPPSVITPYRILPSPVYGPYSHKDFLKKSVCEIDKLNGQMQISTGSY